MSLPSVPPGFQYTTLSKPGGGWDPQSIPYNQSPAVVTGDTLMTPLLDAAGHTVTPTADGIVSVDTGGSTARQLLVGVDIYRVAADAFMGAATFAINDQAPSADPFDDTLVLRQNLAMSTFACGALFSDVELDALTFAVTAGALPNATAINASTGDITGTPDTVGTGSFTVTASDPYNATGTVIITWSVINQVAVPQVSDPLNRISEGAAVALISDASLVSSVGRAFSSSVAFGNVISQSPAADTLVDPGSTVTLTVSLGVARSDVLLTSFLDDSTPVPADAAFISGQAFKQDGSRYVALWPASNAVFYDGPFAYRTDGALIINPSGAQKVRPQGVALTFHGEVIAVADTPVYTHNGWPMREDGTVCMSDVGAGGSGGGGGSSSAIWSDIWADIWSDIWANA